jgi:hypothetical protein
MDVHARYYDRPRYSSPSRYANNNGRLKPMNRLRMARAITCLFVLFVASAAGAQRIVEAVDPMQRYFLFYNELSNHDLAP